MFKNGSFVRIKFCWLWNSISVIFIDIAWYRGSLEYNYAFLVHLEWIFTSKSPYQCFKIRAPMVENLEYSTRFLVCIWVGNGHGYKHGHYYGLDYDMPLHLDQLLWQPAAKEISNFWINEWSDPPPPLVDSSQTTQNN